jgi:hypothetical protein
MPKKSIALLDLENKYVSIDADLSLRKGKVGLLAIMLGAAISSTVLDIPTFVSAEVTK